MLICTLESFGEYISLLRGVERLFNYNSGKICSKGKLSMKYFREGIVLNQLSVLYQTLSAIPRYPRSSLLL